MPSRQAVQSARQLIDDRHVMTLGTASDRGAWTAPVYYYYMAPKFFFFSSPDSRHVIEGLDSSRACSAAVFDDSEGIDRIQGLQMTGKMEKVSKMSAEAGRAVLGYVRQFKLKVPASGVMAFIEEKFHAALFSFTPEQVYYLDNSTGFGHRQEVRL